MLNVSSESEGVGAGVLIRAIVPEVGTAAMVARRRGTPARDLTRGPGRLAAALDIDRSLDGLDLCAAESPEKPLRIAPDDRPRGEVGVSVRIGITRAVEAPLRFYLRGSRFLSGPAWLSP